MKISAAAGCEEYWTVQQRSDGFPSNPWSGCAVPEHLTGHTLRRSECAASFRWFPSHSFFDLRDETLEDDGPEALSGTSYGTHAKCYWCFPKELAPWGRPRHRCSAQLTLVFSQLNPGTFVGAHSKTIYRRCGLCLPQPRRLRV